MNVYLTQVPTIAALVAPLADGNDGGGSTPAAPVAVAPVTSAAAASAALVVTQPSAPDFCTTPNFPRH